MKITTNQNTQGIIVSRNDERFDINIFPGTDGTLHVYFPGRVQILDHSTKQMGHIVFIPKEELPE